MQAAGGFTASFVYTNVNKLGIDGVTFCVQNDPNSGKGPSGPRPARFGYQNIRNSGAVDFNIYNGHSSHRISSSAITCSGGTSKSQTAATLPATAYISTLPADLTDGDPIQVNLAYNSAAGILSETLTDPGKGTFSYSFTGVNFQAVLAGQSGYVGFTGVTGGVNSTQTISNFIFSGGNGVVQYANAVSVAAGTSGELNLGTAYTAAEQVGNLTLNTGTRSTSPAAGRPPPIPPTASPRARSPSPAVPRSM